MAPSRWTSALGSELDLSWWKELPHKGSVQNLKDRRADLYSLGRISGTDPS